MPQNQSRCDQGYKYLKALPNQPNQTRVDIVTHPHIVNAGQQCVIHGTGSEFALQLGINSEVLQFLIIVNILTSQRVSPLD